MAGRRALEVRAAEHRVSLDDGRAGRLRPPARGHGASAKGSAVAGADEGEPLTLRSLEDARRIRAGAAECRAACVLGAGLAGLEMAMALRELARTSPSLRPQGRS